MQKGRAMDRQETFIVHIISQESATWQGQVTWLDEKETKSFRSLLELIKLMDTALGDRETMHEKGEHV